MKKLFVILLTLLSVVTLVGCNGNGGVTEEVQMKDTIKTHGGIIFTLNPHTYSLRSEEEVLERITSSFYRRVINLESDLGYEYIPDMAETDPLCIQEDVNEGEMCYEWQVSVRDGLKMADGTPYAIDVLIDSYKLLLDPAYLNYNANAFFSGMIVENAERYAKQNINNEEVSWDEVGIKRIDEYTMSLTLETPEANNEEGIIAMKSYLSSVALAPVNTEIYEMYETGSDREKQTLYGTELRYLTTNGPYELTKWNIEEMAVIPREYTKSNNYIYKDDYHLKNIVEYVYYGIDEIDQSPKTPVGDFEAGVLDYMNVPSYNYEDIAEVYDITKVDTTTVWSLRINADERKLTSEQENDCWEYRGTKLCYYDDQDLTDELLSNQKFRQALYYLLDRMEMGEEFLQGQKPTNHLLADSFLTNYLTGERYRDTFAGSKVYKDFADTTLGHDLDLAKQLYNEARDEIENTGTEIRISIQVPSGDKRLIEIANWIEKTIEGPEDKYEPVFAYLDIEIETIEIEDMYQNMVSGKYDISFAPTSGDRNNPWEVMFGFNSNNASQFQYKYQNEDVDKLYDALVLNKTVTLSQTYNDSNGNPLPTTLENIKYGDDALKVELLALQEKLVLEDMFVIPVFEEVNNYVFSTDVVLPITYPLPGLGFGNVYDFMVIVQEQVTPDAEEEATE